MSLVSLCLVLAGMSYSGPLFGFVFPDISEIVISLGMVLAGSTGLAGVSLLVALAIVRSRRQLVVSVVAVTGLLLIPLSMSAAQELYVWKSRDLLETLVSDIRAYGRISKMSDGTRYWVTLNGHLFSGSTAAAEIARVIEDEGLSLERYEALRAQLLALELISFEVQDGFIAFLRGGMLDNLVGYLWVEPGKAPPEEGHCLCLARLRSLRHLSGPWYYFATT